MFVIVTKAVNVEIVTDKQMHVAQDWCAVLRARYVQIQTVEMVHKMQESNVIQQTQVEYTTQEKVVEQWGPRQHVYCCVQQERPTVMVPV